MYGAMTRIINYFLPKAKEITVGKRIRPIPMDEDATPRVMNADWGKYFDLNAKFVNEYQTLTDAQRQDLLNQIKALRNKVIPDNALCNQ